MDWMLMLTVCALSFGQNITFTLVSRSRNRDNLSYHLVASLLSNGVWFLTFRQLVISDMTFTLFIPYTVGTVSGSLTGQKIAMVIESWLGIKSDSHLKEKK